LDRVGDRNGIGVGKISDSLAGGGVATGVATGDILGLAVVADATSVGDGVGLVFSNESSSDQSPTRSPFANFACKRVLACTLITIPSNFPSTILPV
jgi:hypothetical protein